VVVATGAICLAHSEKKIKLGDLPAAVQGAVKEQSKGATVKGYAKEVEGGKTFYEVELSGNGHSKDVSFDPTGKVTSVEEETPIDQLPAAAREAIQKAAGKSKISGIETVTENGNTFYEAHIGKKEVKVDAAGKIVK